MNRKGLIFPFDSTTQDGHEIFEVKYMGGYGVGENLVLGMV